MGHAVLKPTEINVSQYNVSQIALGDAHSLFLTETGEVYSCGWHELGQLGIQRDKLNVEHKKGVKIHKVAIQSDISLHLLTATQISCGAVFSVALTKCGDIYAWGSNNNG